MAYGKGSKLKGQRMNSRKWDNSKMSGAMKKSVGKAEQATDFGGKTSGAL